MQEFLRTQEELTEKFDSGFNGYRGLNGEWLPRWTTPIIKLENNVLNWFATLRVGSRNGNLLFNFIPANERRCGLFLILSDKFLWTYVKLGYVIQLNIYR